MHLLAEIPAASTVGIILAAAAGLVGAVVALLRLRPEANQSAVVQAQGAMETMVELNEQLERALEREQHRSEAYRTKYEDLQVRWDAAVEQWGPFPETNTEGAP